jgi:hypothetical protein
MAGAISLMGISAADDVIPTNEWTPFYGTASTYNGQPIPVGSVIDAYDPDGIHCGQCFVKNDGQYGFLEVYGDDDFTEGDQGAEEGDLITFYINGRLAIPEGPSDPIWSGNGPGVEVNLSASGEIAMEPVTDVDYYEAEPGDTVRISTMVRNIGNGIDFYTVSGTTQHGWLVEPTFGFAYAMPDEAVVVEFDVFVPMAIFADMEEPVDYRISSGADASVYIDYNAVIKVLTTPTDVEDEDGSLLPDEFALHQNYPNPFNPRTTMSFSLPYRADVRMEVFDILGRLVVEYDLKKLEAGRHEIEFDGENFSSGVYFYRLKTNDFSDMKKMVLIK